MIIMNVIIIVVVDFIILDLHNNIYLFRFYIFTDRWVVKSRLQ